MPPFEEVVEIDGNRVYARAREADERWVVFGSGSGDTHLGSPATYDPYGLLHDARDGADAARVGREVIDGTAVDRWEVTDAEPEGRTEATLWVDPDTGVVARYRSELRPNATGEPSTRTAIDFAGFGEPSGIERPTPSLVDDFFLPLTTSEPG